MKIEVLPGKLLVIMLNYKGSGTRPYPMVATVLAVYRGAIVVTEKDSWNGLAKIVCHGTSGIDGHYWYEYRDHKRKPHSLDVIALQRIGGDNIVTSSFIKD